MLLFYAKCSQVAPHSFTQAKRHLPLRNLPVGVVGNSQTCMENKSRSIEGASSNTWTSPRPTWTA